MWGLLDTARSLCLPISFFFVFWGCCSPFGGEATTDGRQRESSIARAWRKRCAKHFRVENAACSLFVPVRTWTAVSPGHSWALTAYKRL